MYKVEYSCNKEDKTIKAIIYVLSEIDGYKLINEWNRYPSSYKYYLELITKEYRYIIINKLERYQESGITYYR